MTKAAAEPRPLHLRLLPAGLAAVAPQRRLLLFTLGSVGVAFSLLLMPTGQTDDGLLGLAALAGILLIVAALVSGVAPKAANVGVPFGYLVMIALLRAAEGGANSGFGGLFLVPVIWLGLTSGTLAIALGVLGVIAAQIVPLDAVGAPEYPLSGWRGTVVLSAVAAIAGFTIQALLAESRARARDNARWSSRLESLAEIGNALASDIQLQRLLEITADRLRELLSARLVVVLLPGDPDGLRVAAAAGDDAHDVTDRVLPRDRTGAVELLAGGLPSLWLPLRAHEREIGVLAAVENLHASDGAFSEDDVRVAEIFAARAALAADLSERVEGDAARRVISAQETERRRLALELHDDTGQALTSILIGLETLEGRYAEVPQAPNLIAALRSTAVDALRGVRRIVVELRPKALDDLGLVPALERLTASFSEQTALKVTFSAGDFPQRLPAEVETALYRITQEGLTNVVKHADATEATVLLAPTGQSVLLVIADDGRGFDPEVQARGFGLDGIRERVQLLGGTLEIESSVAGRASLAVEVPLA